MFEIFSRFSEIIIFSVYIIIQMKIIIINFIRVLSRYQDFLWFLCENLMTLVLVCKS